MRSCYLLACVSHNRRDQSTRAAHFVVIAKLSGAKVPVSYVATILSSRDLDFSVHDPWMGHHLRKSQAFRWIQPKHALQKISSLVA